MQNFMAKGISFIQTEEQVFTVLWNVDCEDTRKFLKKMFDFEDIVFFEEILDVLIDQDPEFFGYTVEEKELGEYTVFGIEDDNGDFWYFDNEYGSAAIADDLLCDGQVFLMKLNT